MKTCDTPSSIQTRGILQIVVLMLTVLWSQSRCEAAFHDWYITEVYSSADGTVQFIEMTANSAGQGLFHSFGNNPALRSTNSAGVSVFNISTDVASVTAGKSLIFGTSNLTSIPGGVTPDFIIPPNFVRRPTPGSSATVKFDPSFYATPIYTSLPEDGDLALARVGGSASSTFTNSVNSPKNFNNQSNTIIPVRFLSDQIEDGNIVVSFKTATGVNGSAGPDYTVEYQDSIGDLNWISNTTVGGNGTIRSVTNTITDSDQRFYRLRVP